MEYCLDCSKPMLTAWKGVPWKTIVRWRRSDRQRVVLLPPLPEIIDGLCQSCGHSSPLKSEHIAYFNVSAGLPDYWTLVILGDQVHQPAGSDGADLDHPKPQSITQDFLDWSWKRFGKPYPADFLEQQLALMTTKY